MQVIEAKNLALGVAANISIDDAAPGKATVSAAMTYLCGKTDRAAFLKKCAKNPLYARAVIMCEHAGNDFGADAYCATHKTLFEPKPKCGELRTGELVMTGGSCADPKLLRGSLKNVLTKLQQMQSAPAVNKADFAAQLCCYMRELIILSPFSYGNGTARRAFVQNFCSSRGFSLNYAAIGKAELIAAESEAFATDDPQPLFSALIKCLNYAQDETQNSTARKPSRRAALPPHNKIQAKQQEPAKQLEPKKSADNAKQPELKKTAENAKQSDSKKFAEQSKSPDVKKSEPKKQQDSEREKNEALRELREIKRALENLTSRVNEVIKNLNEK
ncbi:hypothetical protein [Pumilibacter muris]|uniref:hypothetical protein n=1 Tax=Pumilibacter muris TaxID=2941510 RepID=UPI0020419A06|nr:hypothetical protein [Pumilibacter muris]